MAEDPPLAGLIRLLDQAVQQRRPLGYLELAERLDIPGPGRIRAVAALLETLMEEDARAGKPLRAAMMSSRLRPDRPASGFFDCARRLGLLDSDTEQAEQNFHQQQLEGLYTRSSSSNA